MKWVMVVDKDKLKVLNWAKRKSGALLWCVGADYYVSIVLAAYTARAGPA